MRPSPRLNWRRIPLGWTLGLVAGLVALIAYIQRTGAFTQGHYIFALDDPYISMGIAKNLVNAGTWGTSPTDFSSASSSILWPIALALSFVVTGTHALNPHVLNVIALLWGAVLVRRIVLREAPRMRSSGAWSLALWFLPAMAAPVTSLLLTGLEHIWHWIAVLSAVDAAAVALARAPDRRLERHAWLWAPALTLVRYETMALVVIIASLAAAQRRWRLAGLYLWNGLAPVLVFGLWSRANGAMFFPNSLVLKASPGGQGLVGKIGVALSRMASSIATHREFATLMLAALLTVWILHGRGRVFRRWPAERRGAALHLWCFLGMALAHAGFASFGWLFRYEAYLLAWGSFAVGLGLLVLLQERLDRQPRSIALSFVDATQAAVSTVLRQQGWIWYRSLALAACVLYGGYHLWHRSELASERAVLATRNIYEQQYQFARFLKRHYPQTAIALNDIGAASFFPDIRVVDLYGLGSTEVAKLKHDRVYGREAIETLTRARDVPVAIVYDRWFQGYGGMPASWTRVGRWKIRNNVICGDDEVSFYGTSDTDARELEAKLRAFAPSLPERVTILSDEGFNISRPSVRGR